MLEDEKKLRWYNLALMAFVSVWGFGNVVNNFANQGLKVIVSWVLIIGLYFVPYALMVGELGSVFKDGKAVDQITGFVPENEIVKHLQNLL